MVLVIHGLLDNAGCFDTLIPLLPQSFCYVCIDLPGHGHSSHLDHSQPLHLTSFIPAIKLVADHFKRANYIIMGHSFGTLLSFTFAQLYPKDVTKVILLDGFMILKLNNPEVVSKRTHGSHAMLTNVSKKTKRSYSYEEAVEKVQASRLEGKLNWESANNITKRMLKRENGRYMFTHDERLKVVLGMLNFNVDWEKEMAKEGPMRFPVFIILYTPYNKYMVRLVDLVACVEKLPNFFVHRMEGDHFLHTNRPHLVNGIISEFLLKKNSNL